MINLVDLCVLVGVTHAKRVQAALSRLDYTSREPLRLREVTAVKRCASTALVPAHHCLCQRESYRLPPWESEVCCLVSPLPL